MLLSLAMWLSIISASVIEVLKLGQIKVCHQDFEVSKGTVFYYHALGMLCQPPTLILHQNATFSE